MQKLLTAEEVAEVLQVSPRTIREWARTRKIPAVRVSRKVRRFDLQDVLATIKGSGESLTNPEVVPSGQDDRGANDGPQIVHSEDLEEHIAAGRSAGLCVVKTEHIDSKHVAVFWSRAT